MIFATKEEAYENDVRVELLQLRQEETQKRPLVRGDLDRGDLLKRSSSASRKKKREQSSTCDSSFCLRSNGNTLSEGFDRTEKTLRKSFEQEERSYCRSAI